MKQESSAETSSLLANGFWSTYGVASAKILALISNLILANLLLPEDYGVIGAAYIFWAFANLFSQGIIDSFIVYKGVDEPAVINTAFTASCIAGVFLTSSFILSAPLISSFFNIPELRGVLTVYSINLLLSFLCTFYSGILQKNMRYKDVARATFLSSIARLIGANLVAFSGYGYWAFVCGDMAYWGILFLLLRQSAHYPVKLAIDPSVIRSLVTYCSGSVGSSAGSYMSMHFDSLVVGKFLGREALGLYNLFYQLTTAMLNMLVMATMPLARSVFVKIQDHGKRYDALLKVVEHFSFLAAPLFSLIFLCITPETVSIFLGEKWIPACVVVPWLCMFAYFRSTSTPLNAMLQATGYTGTMARVNLLIAPLAVSSFWLGAQKAELLGVAIAVGSVLGIVWSFYLWFEGARTLSWPMLPFVQSCLLFFSIAVASIMASMALPVFLRPFSFVALYLVASSWIAPESPKIIPLFFRRILTLMKGKFKLDSTTKKSKDSQLMDKIHS